MADRWIYQHDGKVEGPVTYERLKQLAENGEILPTEFVWPEGNDPRRAVEAQYVLNFAAIRQTRESAGAWAENVAQALASKPNSPSGTPDWLAGMQAATSGEAVPSASTPAKPPLPAPATMQPTTRPASPSPATPNASVVPTLAPGNVLFARPVGPSIAQPAARSIPYPPRLIAGGASSKGRVRERNEDRFGTQQWSWNDADGAHEVALLTVADGMGGYQAGNEAAVLTVHTVATSLAAYVVAAMGGRRQDAATLAAALVQAVRLANSVVLQKANAEARCKEMGATVAVAWIWDDHAYVSHVGDCRVYLHRGGELKQLTEDHTLVARMVKLGKLTEEEAAHHESSNEVTQAIGKRPTVEPSQADHVLKRGDYLVMACDGLAAHVERSTIQDAINRLAIPSQHLASQLVQMADEGGGSDNCTVIVAHFA